MPKLNRLPQQIKTLESTLRTVDANSWRSAKTSSTARGYGYKWQQARAAYLEAHPFCVFCLRDAGIQATTTEGVILECAAKGMPAPRAQVVDHIVPHRGDQTLFWNRRNWAAICTHHHNSEKQAAERRNAA